MDQLQKAGGPATSVGIDQNRARVRLFLMTPNVSCRSAVKAAAVSRSMITAIRGERPSPPESLRLLLQIADSGCFNRLRARRLWRGTNINDRLFGATTTSSLI